MLGQFEYLAKKTLWENEEYLLEMSSMYAR